MFPSEFRISTVRKEAPTENGNSADICATLETSSETLKLLIEVKNADRIEPISKLPNPLS